MRDDNIIESWLGCLLWLAIPFGLYFGCSYCESRSKKEKEEVMRIKRQNDSLRHTFILDSLKNDPHYQDSLRREREKYSAWRALHDSICSKEIIGFVFEGDSIYHNFIHGMIEKEDGEIHNYSLKDMPKIRFISNCDIENESLHKCYDCKDAMEEFIIDYIDDFYYLFEDDDDY